MKHSLMKELVEKLNDAAKAYDENKPYMPDTEWDNLYFQLAKLENELGYTLPNSPTQKINYEVINELKKVKHNHPMLSLDKTKEISDVNSFLNGEEAIIMCKMDGLTCSLLYEDGKLVRAETRGNGIIGEDITHNAKVIPSIPKTIPYKERFIVDGEIICRYPDFEPFKNEYKNPRNFAAGSIRLLDSGECKNRNLTFVLWDVIEGLKEEDSLSCKMSPLDACGFTIVPFMRMKSLNEDWLTWVKDIAKKRGFPIDGAVIKIDSISKGKEMGKTAHHFNNAIAYKFADEVYPTTLKDIEWTMGRTGVLTPVAIFEPIDINGSEISRASLHNVSVMESTLGLAPYVGMEIEVFKANMIIPQIKPVSLIDGCSNTVDKLFHKTLDEEPKHKYIHAPLVCPICGQVLIEKNNDGVKTLFCTRLTCEGKFINKLDHFCSKKGLDIKGLSKATLEKLIDWGYVKELNDLFLLDIFKNTWMKQSGFGEKSVNKILQAIQDAAQNATLESVISAAGIPLIGRTVAKDLANRFKTYENFREHINKGFDFSLLDGYGPEMNKALLMFDYKELDYIVESYIKFKEEEKTSIEVNNSLDGKVFVITGKLKNYKNRDELKSKIESMGGKVAGSVSSKTNYLINNDATSNSAKNVSAKKLGVEIITEEEFHKIFDF